MKKKANKKKEIKKIIFLSLAILVVLSIIATLCLGYYRKATYEVKNPVATLEIKDYGTIKIELYPEYAENTVKNFIALANNGFYDGLTFHRILKEFMIQGGDPKGDGSGSPTLGNIGYKNNYNNGDVIVIEDASEDGTENNTEYNIDGEFILNGYENNTLKLEKGVIAMARGDYSSYAYYAPSLVEEGYNSAGSQFFIMTTDDNVSLTGSYAGFGKVIEGYDVLEKVANVKVKAASEEDTEVSTPVEDVIITSIKVETFGENYGKPETHEPFDINSYFSSMMSY